MTFSYTQTYNQYDDEPDRDPDHRLFIAADILVAMVGTLKGYPIENALREILVNESLLLADELIEAHDETQNT